MPRKYPKLGQLEDIAPRIDEKEESEEECKQRLCDHIFSTSEFPSQILLLSQELESILKEYLGNREDVLFAHYVLRGVSFELQDTIPLSRFADFQASKSREALATGPKPIFQPSPTAYKGGPPPPPKAGAEAVRPPFKTDSVRPPDNSPSPRPVPPVKPSVPPSQPGAINPPKFGLGVSRVTPPPPPLAQSTSGPGKSNSSNAQPRPGPPLPSFAPSKTAPTETVSKAGILPTAKPGPAAFLPSIKPYPPQPMKKEEEEKSPSHTSTVSTGPTDPGTYKLPSRSSSSSSSLQPGSTIKAANQAIFDQFVPDLTQPIVACINETFQRLSQQATPSLDTVKDTLLTEVRTVLNEYHCLHLAEVSRLQQKVEDLLAQAKEGSGRQRSNWEQALGEAVNMQKAVTEEVNRLVSHAETGTVAIRLQRNAEMLERLNGESTNIYNGLPEITRSKRKILIFDALDFDSGSQSLTITYTNRKLYPIQGQSICFCILDNEWKYEYVTEIAPGQHKITIHQSTTPQNVICCYLNDKVIGESRIDYNSQGKLVFVGLLDEEIMERNREKAARIRQDLHTSLSPELEEQLDRLMTTEEFDIWEIETIKSKLLGS